MLTICAWCKARISEDDREPVDRISHGICNPCRVRMLAPVQAVPTAPRCSHGKAPEEWCGACECEV